MNNASCQIEIVHEYDCYYIIFVGVDGSNSFLIVKIKTKISRDKNDCLGSRSNIEQT
jgi:hypothetical protein